MIKSKMLLNRYDIENAKKVLFSTDHKIDIVGVDEVFYPYISMHYSVAVGKGRLSKLNKLYHCIIDGVMDSAYEVKGELLMDDVEIEGDKSLEFQVTPELRRKTGHDFIMKLFLGKEKLLMIPDIELVREEAFYKKFYIMHCRDNEERDYYVMVDAVDGGLSILDH